MPERYDIPPERLGRWLARWAAANAPVALSDYREDEVVFRAASGARATCRPPFPPLAGSAMLEGFEPAPLLEHATRERVAGVLLVRLGAAAAGVFAGGTLRESKVQRRLVHGRHRKGGSSARRFERRREGQARESLASAADLAARILLPALPHLEAVVLGGDRGALTRVMADPRLSPLQPLVSERVIEVPEPRLAVLEAAPDLFRSTRIELSLP